MGAKWSLAMLGLALAARAGGAHQDPSDASAPMGAGAGGATVDYAAPVDYTVVVSNPSGGPY